ncbi:MAG: Ni/Fe hydrogenase subunit gamma [Acidobacteria bacterium]|nr:MAG: Ni/Fe hydrogenase subunit gamma [Acidobacteriota bacterium]
MIEAAKPDAMTPVFCRVLKTHQETRDTFTIDLEPPSGPQVLPFAPGQFNMLYVFGVGEVPISVSGDPRRTHTLVHTVREVGAVTQAMRRLKRGEVLGVRGPFGSSWPVEQAVGKDVVIVAGGIGLAPLRPAIYSILAHRQEYGRVVLLYGTRTPEDILFRKELERWRARLDLSVHVTVDRALASWRGSVGVVTTIIPRAHFDSNNALAMICGPEAMMSFTVLELENRGVGLEHIYVSTERNMKCAIGFCGHCQLGPKFICKDGPVFPYDRIRQFFEIREI